VVRPTHTALMSGWHIFGGSYILHETIHELHTKKIDDVLFQIEFEKTQDKVKWAFFYDRLRAWKVW
jgi:hypothetical protein